MEFGSHLVAGNFLYVYLFQSRFNGRRTLGFCFGRTGRIQVGYEISNINPWIGTFYSANFHFWISPRHKDILLASSMKQAIFSIKILHTVPHILNILNLSLSREYVQRVPCTRVTRSFEVLLILHVVLTSWQVALILPKILNFL